MHRSSSPSILLINPPVAKPCEPPPSIARLGGALRDAGIDCSLLDLNLSCLLDQFERPGNSSDTWSRRAWKHRHANLDAIRSADTYRSPDRYRRTVQDLNRVIGQVGRGKGLDITLENIASETHSPLSSRDLLDSARAYRENHFFPSFRNQLREALSENVPGFIGVSLSYLSQALAGFALLGYIRDSWPEVKLVVGGGLITSWMNSPSWNSQQFGDFIDHCVKGVGEAELIQILGGSAETRLGSYDYRDFPLDDYLAPGRILPYAASHGCYWKRCRFCPDHAEDSCYLTHPAGETMAELGALIERYNPSLVHLLDNAISPPLLRKIAGTGLTVPWYGFARFEKDLEDLEFCRSLKQSGCVMLKLGLESGSQRVLDRLDKGVDLERAARVLRNLHRCGIGTYVYLLFGTPAETEEDAKLTLEFVRSHYETITFFNLAIFNMPICGSEAGQIADRFSDGDLSLYCNFEHPSGWDRRQVRLFLQKKFRKDPLIRAIDQRNPGVFGSNHAPFFV